MEYSYSLYTLILIGLVGAQRLYHVHVDKESPVRLGSTARFRCSYLGDNITLQYVSWTKLAADGARVFVYEFSEKPHINQAYNDFTGRAVMRTAPREEPRQPIGPPASRGLPGPAGPPERTFPVRVPQSGTSYLGPKQPPQVSNQFVPATNHILNDINSASQQRVNNGSDKTKSPRDSPRDDWPLHNPYTARDEANSMDVGVILDDATGDDDDVTSQERLREMMRMGEHVYGGTHEQDGFLHENSVSLFPVYVPRGEPRQPKPLFLQNSSDPSHSPVFPPDSFELANRYREFGGQLEAEQGEGGRARYRRDLPLNHVDLFLSHVRLSDEATYECTVKPLGGAALSDTVAMTVQVPPSAPVITSVGSGPFVESQNLTLECRANVGKPAGQLSWARLGPGDATLRQVTDELVQTTTSLAENDTTLVDSRLQLLLSEADDGSLYRCTAASDILSPYETTLYAQITLDVHYPPRGGRILFDTAVGRYYCHARGKPAPSYAWIWIRPDRQQTIMSSDRYLDLRGMRESGYYRFHCLASNIIKGIRHTKVMATKLRVLAPSEPTTAAEVAATTPTAPSEPPPSTTATSTTDTTTTTTTTTTTAPPRSPSTETGTTTTVLLRTAPTAAPYQMPPPNDVPRSQVYFYDASPAVNGASRAQRLPPEGTSQLGTFFDIQGRDQFKEKSASIRNKVAPAASWHPYPPKSADSNVVPAWGAASKTKTTTVRTSTQPHFRPPSGHQVTTTTEPQYYYYYDDGDQYLYKDGDAMKSSLKQGQVEDIPDTDGDGDGEDESNISVEKLPSPPARSIKAARKIPPRRRSRAKKKEVAAAADRGNPREMVSAAKSTEYNCADRPDGVYGAGCRAFYRCRQQQAYFVECKRPYVYNKRNGECDKPDKAPAPCGIWRDCAGKMNEKFADTERACRYYYTCWHSFFMGHNECNKGLVFNEKEQLCDWPENVPSPCGLNGVVRKRRKMTKSKRLHRHYAG